MTILTSVRTKLESKVFSKIGSSVTITPITITVDSRGDKTESNGTPVSTTAVPYGTSLGLSMSKMSAVNEYETYIVFKYTETVNIGYKVTWNSTNWYIVDKQEYVLEGGIVCYICKLSKVR